MVRCIAIAAAALAALLTSVPRAASADELDDLRAENARLRERVEHLERENERLRRIGPDPARMDEAAVAERLTVTETPSGELVTVASVPLVVIDGSRADHALELETTGDDTTADGTIRATFRTWFSGSIHRGVDEITLEADHETFHLPVVDYRVTPITTGSPQHRRRRDHERLVVEMPAGALSAAATAHSVGGRIGRVRFMIEPADQATLRAFALRTEDATP